MADQQTEQNTRLDEAAEQIATECIEQALKEVIAEEKAKCCDDTCKDVCIENACCETDNIACPCDEQACATKECDNCECVEESKPADALPEAPEQDSSNTEKKDSNETPNDPVPAPELNKQTESNKQKTYTVTAFGHTVTVPKKVVPVVSIVAAGAVTGLALGAYLLGRA